MHIFFSQSLSLIFSAEFRLPIPLESTYSTTVASAGTVSSNSCELHLIHYKTIPLSNEESCLQHFFQFGGAVRRNWFHNTPALYDRIHNINAMAVEASKQRSSECLIFENVQSKWLNLGDQIYNLNTCEICWNGFHKTCRLCLIEYTTAKLPTSFAMTMKHRKQHASERSLSLSMVTCWNVVPIYAVWWNGFHKICKFCLIEYKTKLVYLHCVLW